MKKKNWFVFPALLLILAGLVFASVFSCKDKDDGPKVGNVIGTFTGTDTNGKVCTLQIKDDDTYEFFIDENSISTGTAAKDGDTYTLTANGGGDPFTVTVKEGKITEIKGAITPDDGSKPIAPPVIPPPFNAVAGVWVWSLSDDADPNTHINPQTIFAPGGASRVDNAVEDPVEQDRYGNPVKRPYEYTAGTVKDNDGNTINLPVYNFKGNTKVSKDNRTANEGARFPMVGWEAVPDEATLAQLKTAYGYTFWVRLNSATGDSWAFLTAIVTDYVPEKGYEYKHWFGNKPGDSGGSKTPDYTGKLELGKWYQITVVTDKSSPAFNMEQAKWMIQYYPNADDPDNKIARDKPYDQSKAEKLQWQIPLQHQKTGTGEAERTSKPYDVIKGSYDFDLDFYGLELLIKQ